VGVSEIVNEEEGGEWGGMKDEGRRTKDEGGWE
jgi:hypothetical protein